MQPNDTTKHSEGPLRIKTTHQKFGLSRTVRGGCGRVPQWSRKLQDYIVSTGPHLHTQAWTTSTRAAPRHLTQCASFGRNCEQFPRTPVDQKVHAEDFANPTTSSLHAGLKPQDLQSRGCTRFQINIAQGKSESFETLGLALHRRLPW